MAALIGRCLRALAQSDDANELPGWDQQGQPRPQWMPSQHAPLAPQNVSLPPQQRPPQEIENPQAAV